MSPSNTIEWPSHARLLTESSLKLLNAGTYHTSNSCSCLRLTMPYPSAVTVTPLAIRIVRGSFHRFIYWMLDFTPMKCFNALESRFHWAVVEVTIIARLGRYRELSYSSLAIATLPASSSFCVCLSLLSLSLFFAARYRLHSYCLCPFFSH